MAPARPAQHVHRRRNNWKGPNAKRQMAGPENVQRRTRRSASTIGGAAPDTIIGRAAADRAGARPYVRLRVRTNSGVEVPIGQNTGCP